MRPYLDSPSLLVLAKNAGITTKALIMRYYFYKGIYTSEAWKGLVDNPRDISEAMKPSIERFGGRVVACFQLLGGEPEGFIEFPDDAASMAWAIYLRTTGLLRDIELTPVMSTEEGLKVLRTVG